ncbi:hypothetical protein HMI55_000082 [Coelomomyces lativittatus]|nr:hypothetical protein HMI55_000082 [Coelomomyces lativittatus]
MTETTQDAPMNEESYQAPQNTTLGKANSPELPLEKESTPTIETIAPSSVPLSPPVEEELAQRELSLVELVALMDEYKPLKHEK